MKPTSLVVFVLVQFAAASAFAAHGPNEMFFSAPVNLSHSQDALAYGARVSVDATGTTNAVWADVICAFPVPCVSHVFFSRSADAGRTFSIPRDISNGNPAFEPGIAVDRQGNINVLWQESQLIYFSRSEDDGVTFSTPTNISNIAEPAFSPRIAVDRRGNINAVWQTQSVVSPSISNVAFAHSLDGGLHFSAARNLCDVAETCGAVEIAVESTGALDVVWAQEPCPGCALDVFFSRSADGGTTFPAGWNLSSSDLPLVTAPLLVVDDAGNINVVWSKGDFSSAIDVYFSRSSNHGRTFSTRGLSNGQGHAYSPRVGIDGTGRINVFWLDNAFGGIFFTRSVNGGTTFSVPVIVSGMPSGFSASDPYVAVSRDGAANIVWGDGIQNGILFRRSTNGATFSAPADLWGGATASFFPQLIADASGGIAVAWYAEVAGASGTDVYVTRGTSLNSLENDVASVPAAAFKNRGQRQLMLSKLDDVEKALARRETLLAVLGLEDVLGHVNGCGLQADGNDWITDCAAQLRIRSSVDTVRAGLVP